MARFRRRAKGEAKGEAKASDAVDLSESEHAWWASGRVQHAYGLTTESPPAPVPDAPEFEPWTFTDVFAANIDGEIDHAGAPDGQADTARPPGDTRDLAEVFLEESSYRALGLPPGASWDEVVQAHRAVAKRFHPDRLIHADEATREQGEEQMRAANAAYEHLRKQHHQNQRPTTGLFNS